LDIYQVLGTMVRESVMEKWSATTARYHEQGAKQVYYLSMEFLLGRLLESNLINLRILELCREGLHELGIDLDDIIVEEPDAGLGNGGLGRLAACFLDSLASLGLPGHGCGIRYKYGLFEQKIIDGYQIELPENWLKEGNVWEIRRAEETVEVKFGGHIEFERRDGRYLFHHKNAEIINAVPYDMPMIGFGGKTVNTLRLWDAETSKTELCDIMDCYRRIVDYKHNLESITELLYPDDSHHEGKVLRLKQQYFLVSAAIQSITRDIKTRYGSLEKLNELVAIHINDTHPALAIPELMRILMDKEGMSWDKAWKITTGTISYTNHTTLGEALEKWSVELFKPLLPRIYMIVEEINNRFCQTVWHQYPHYRKKIGSMAIIADGYVKMAHLALVGCHSINGVAKLHTEILKHREMKNFYGIFPKKFNNKTNGITHRRWLLKVNPLLAKLINETIGPDWIRHPHSLLSLSDYAEDSAFLDSLYRIKQSNKATLARFIENNYDLKINIHSIFDIQVKRLHLYKRQLLNILQIMDLYNRLLENPGMQITPHTFIFAAKAFPNYHLAKNIIKLINTVAGVINRDRRIKDQIKVVFLENYRVSLADIIIPAADLSQQISTASKEASGTGNMKFMLNGAVTIGTRDGANIEIMEAVGEDNIITFGMTAREVNNYYKNGRYRSINIYNADPRIRKVVDQLVNGFLPVGRHEFRAIYDHLIAYNDEFFVLKDFSSYGAAREKAERAYGDRAGWQKKCAVNIAHAGKFSSDLTIKRYADEIWEVEPVTSTLPAGIGSQ
ncbi:MAG: glycogen/starch/alpha-glucan phosphorylase, partial [Dethiobacteria bacterium]